MSMVVQHNMQAANANRMLGITTGAQSKSTEKLSSGYKINRAADDAAGLSISEKMRKQIRGLDKASSNAQDGVSAVQTAEGALTEVHSMLQRMNELAVQAANGTNSKDTDRKAIQDEIDQLTTEIDRVSETTKFNETYLLKGNVDGTSSAKQINAHDAGLAGKLTDNGDGTATFNLDKALADGDKVTIAGKEYTIGSTTTSADGYGKLSDLAAKTLGVGDSVTTAAGDKYTLVDEAANADATYTSGMEINIDGKKYTIDTTTDLSADKLKASDATKLVSEALQKGKDASITKTGTAAAGNMYAAGSAVDIKIVSSLDTGAISSLDCGGATAGKAPTADELAQKAGAALAAGDTVTVKGTSTKATTSDPATMNTIKDVVKQLKETDAVDIGGKTLTIAKETNVANDEYTVDDVLALLNDNDEVTFTATTDDAKNALAGAGLKANTTYTAVDTKTSSDAKNVISVKDAYSMMADELAKASSIGTDKGSEATVKSNNSGSFTITKGTAEVKDALSFSLHVGADADMTNKINVDIDSMSAAGLGIKGLNISDDNGAKR